jgi:capsular polysaccharide biosynthesis protein
MNSLFLFQLPKINLVPLKQRLYRHWLLLVIPLGLVLLFSLFTFRIPPTLVTQTSRVFIGHVPLASNYESEKARQFNWLSSEFLVVGIKEWVNGTIFAGMVRDKLIASGMEEDEMSVNDLVEYIEAESSRGVLLLQVSHPDEAVLNEILTVAEGVLVANHAPYIPQLNGEAADMTLMDRTLVREERPSLVRPLAELVIRLLTAVLGGVVLMFVVEYFEPVVHSAWEVQGLGLENMGEIPRGRGE